MFENALCVLHFDLKMMALNMMAQATLLNQNVASGCCMNSSCSWKCIFFQKLKGLHHISTIALIL